MKKSEMNVPRLRFPGFEGEWLIKKLGEVSIKMQSGISRKLSDEDIGLPILRSNNISDGNLNIEDIKYWFLNDDQGADLTNYILKEGDLLVNFINSQAQIGKSALFTNALKRDTIFTTNILRLSVSPAINSKFLFHNFQTPVFNNYIKSITKPAVNQASFTTVEFRNYLLGVPAINEQNKVAKFFTIIERKRKELRTKKSLLEQYKKGMMQKIFNQEVRFKDDDGKEFGEWDYYPLKDLAKRVTTKNKGISTNVLTISAQQGLVSQLEFFNKSVAAKDISGYYLLNKDDFAYNKSYSAGYPMGAIKRLKRYDDGVVSTLYICFRFNEGINLDFMEQYFASGLQSAEIEKVAQEGARNHGLLNIGIDDFFSISILLPLLNEQTKIANFLSAIDDKINVMAKQIEKMEEWKKGLMGEMFV